ncbi:unnamed protein product [Phytophthora lilii]|uniref:Unnamed protein product n=1 Tax=Phytophthora lilii TaxID=2077276 RepID=A0A9W6YEG3_9STRA|nr:unnamed protein product [Phytophthora lilii]
MKPKPSAAAAAKDAAAAYTTATPPVTAPPPTTSPPAKMRVNFAVSLWTLKSKDGVLTTEEDVDTNQRRYYGRAIRLLKDVGSEFKDALEDCRHLRVKAGAVAERPNGPRKPRATRPVLTEDTITNMKKV